MQVNTIIFPTDFTTCSTSALKHAVRIAETFYSKLILVHVTFDNRNETADNPKIQRRIQNNKLNEFKLEILQRNPLLNITTVLLNAENAEPILELIEDENADLVVMGAKGEGGIKDISLSTFASEIVENSLCPVLSVPEGNTGYRYQKIVYASDLEHIDVAAIKELTSFATYFNSEVTILNISDQTRRFSEDQLFKFEKLVRETCTYPKLDFIYFHGTDLNFHIQEYLNRNSADLFVITTIKESLVSNLFKDKSTKKLSYHTHLPLLSFHESDKCCQQVSQISISRIWG